MRQPIDFKESYDGDLVFEGGDIADTEENYHDAAYQIIRTVLSSKPGEIPTFPTIGFNPDRYVGSPNNEETGFDIARAIKHAIVSSTMFYDSEVEVAPFPVGKNTIAFRVAIKNVSGDDSSLTVSYDTSDNFVRSLVFDDSDEKQQTIKVNLPQAKI